MGDEDDDACELENYFVLETGSHANAGSTVSAIELHLGGFLVYLNAPAGGFQPNQILTYNFNNTSCPSCWNSMDPDDWDDVRLETQSHNGIQVARVQMVHSGQLVLETDVGAWLDEDYGSVLDFSIDVAQARWELADSTRVTAVYYAAQDLGQTGAQKYVGSDVAWCSECASWAIGQSGLGTPSGSIDTAIMENWFRTNDRKFTKSEVQAGKFRAQAASFAARGPSPPPRPLGVEPTRREGATRRGVHPGSDRDRTRREAPEEALRPQRESGASAGRRRRRASRPRSSRLGGKSPRAPPRPSRRTRRGP